MSRFIVAFAFLLMASTVSAQTSNNVTFWTNSGNCGVNTTDGLTVNATSFLVPDTCLSQTLNNGFVINVTSSCNNVTGVVSVNVYNSSQCSGTPVTTLTSSSCISGLFTTNVSAIVAPCTIAPTPIPTNTTTAPTPSPTPAVNTTAQPTQPTNGTTPKPSVAAAGFSFSLMAAAAAVILVALF